MYNDSITVTVSAEQAVLLQKFAVNEERKVQRRINSLQRKIDAMYSLKYAASDFAYLVQSKLDGDSY